MSVATEPTKPAYSLNCSMRVGKAEEMALGGPVLSTVKFGRIWWA